MLIQTQLCSADTFGVSVGETFTYECITSERTLVWGSNSSLSEGYSLDDHHFAEGTAVSVEVTHIDDNVYYVVSKDGFEAFHSSDALSLSLAILFEEGSIIYSFYSIINHIEQLGWNQTLLDQGPYLLCRELFVEIDSTSWSDLIDVVTSKIEHYSTAIVTYDDSFLGEIEVLYVNSDSTFAYEFHYSGVLNVTYTPTSPISPWTKYSDDVEYYQSFVYDKTTGALLGMHSYGSMTGTSNGTNFEYAVDSHIEKEGYDLPVSILSNTKGFSGYSIAIAFGSMTTLVMIAVYVRRKKATI